jgi:lysine 2,3-aminomutase
MLETDLEVKSDAARASGRPSSLSNSQKSTSTPGLYDFKSTDYWRSIPAWKEVGRTQFADHSWQQQNSVNSLEDLARVIDGKLAPEILSDLAVGLQKSPMRIRLTPYIFALMDWNNPDEDPIRKQFLLLGSQLLADHPYCTEDSLDEEGARVAPYLYRRYRDKVLFLSVGHCPVYCYYCTRSRLVGPANTQRRIATFQADSENWRQAHSYILANTEIEDVVISGGDVFMMRPEQIKRLGVGLLSIPHIRRIRFATRGISILPMKINSDHKWLQALQEVSDFGRSHMKEVCVHTHFCCENEITEWTHAAMKTLTAAHVVVRNQTVLLSGINDSYEQMYRLIKKLAYINIQPYYIYLTDMVPGCEHLRTTISEAASLSQELQGVIAGFNTPRVVCDTPGGGGKREVSSYEEYDEELGISAWVSPRLKPGQVYYYYDPIHKLPKAGQLFWSDPRREQRLQEFRAELERRIYRKYAWI